MGKWFTPKRVIWLSFAAIVVFLLADGFIARPAYEVHTPGATPLKVAAVTTDITYNSYPTPAGESISELRCQLWLARFANTPCPTDVSSRYLASIAQTVNTLYVLWFGCVDWLGAGRIINWQGYNLEFLQSERKLIVHCYIAEPWLAYHERLYGVSGVLPAILLLVPTDSMGSGPIYIIEDDRQEHLVGDQSTEFTIGSAMIT
jgi:hypothetical protein